MIGGYKKAVSGWRTVQLGDVAEQCLGKMLDAKKNKGRPLQYLRNPNVRWFDVDTSDLREMPFEDDELDRYGLREGDVLVCEGGEAGRAAIWDGRVPNVKFQKAIHRVRPGPCLFNRFLVYRLMADYHSGRLADYYTGATIKHMTGQDLARYEFLLPPLSEQQRIAELLDRAEALRAKRRAALAQLEALTHSIFVNLFGDPARNNQSLPTIALGELGDWRSGGTPPRSTSEYFEGTIPWFSSGELAGMYAIRSNECISARALKDTSVKAVPRGALMLGMYDTAALKASIAGVDGACNQAISFATIDSELAETIFVYFAVVIGKEYFRRLQRGVRQKNLNLSMIRELRIPLPNLPRQREFVRCVSALEKFKAAHRASLAEMDALFASLQHRAFRGEL